MFDVWVVYVVKGWVDVNICKYVEFKMYEFGFCEMCGVMDV